MPRFVASRMSAGGARAVRGRGDPAPTRRRARRAGVAASVAILLFAAAPEASARVFFRWLASRSPDRAIEAVGGVRAYEAPVTVNGEEGRLSVYGFTRSVAEVVADLDRRVRPDHWEYQGGSMALAIVSERSGRAGRLLVLGLESHAQTLVFCFTPDRAASARKSEVQTPAIAGLVPFPGSRPVFTAVNARTRLSLAIHRVSDDAGSILAFYDTQLTGAGWAPVPPTARPSSGLTVYTRGREVCAIGVEARGNARESRITLLHKRLDVE